MVTNPKILKRTLLLIIFSLSALALPACEFSFALLGPDGERSLRPGTETALEQGARYTLEVTFTEDHGRCLLTPEDTKFYLEEVKWKPGRELPLLLQEAAAWETVDGRSHRALLPFQAVDSGSFRLEILRECDKGGYDELLLFSVSS
jgi:hypothetical protein